ncbi:hypothetical protein D3C77_514990 [compost metagenome]
MVLVIPANSRMQQAIQNRRWSRFGLLNTNHSAMGMAMAMSMANRLGSVSNPAARPSSWYLVENIAITQVTPTLRLTNRHIIARLSSRPTSKVIANSSRPTASSRKWPSDSSRFSLAR